MNQPQLVLDAYHGRFSRKALRVSLNLSDIAYATESQGLLRLRNLGWTNPQYFCHEGAECYVAQGPGLTIVTFRGSGRNWGDWRRNFHLLKRRANGSEGFSHGGFSLAWHNLRKLIQPHLRGPRLFFTGHSQGDDLAREAVLDLITDSQWPTTELEYDYAWYGFGGAPTFNHQAVQHVNLYLGQQGWRMVNNLDAIPRMNTKSLHPGNLMYLSGSKVFVPPHNWGRLAWDRVKSRVLSPQVGEGIADHDVNDYARTIHRVFGLQGTDLKTELLAQ